MRVAWSDGDLAKKNNRGETLITCDGTPPRPFPLVRLALFAALALAAALVFLIGGSHYFSLQSLAEHRLALRDLVAGNYALAILAYVLVYTAAIVLLFPTAAALTLAGGFLFGWQVGLPLTVIAATFGATIVFLLAKTTLGEPLARRAGPWLCKVRNGFQKDALTYLLFLRLVPAFPFWFMNLAPALLGVGLRDFVVATALGIIPGTLAFSFIGSGIDAILIKHHQAYLDCLAGIPAPNPPCEFNLSPHAFVTPELIAALILLGVIAILPAIVKRLWKSKASRA
jgi:uncharacterized membrane protein YdjX (TVP38/TMEM64 family)